MTSDHGDPAEELASELRQRLGGEFRAEAEEGERLAELARLRGRGLAAVAAESRDRGDRVRIHVGGRVFAGVIIDAGVDHCTLRGPVGIVEIPLGGRPVRLSVDEPHAVEPPIARAGPPPRTLRSRLRELELEGADVEVGTEVGDEPVRGRLLAVAEDHVLLEGSDHGRIFVGWEGISYVLRREDG